MCGIAAIFSERGAFESIGKHLVAMMDVIRHRGPDDEGVVVFTQDSSPLILGGSDTPDAVFHSSLAYAPRYYIRGDEKGAVAMGHRRLSIVDLTPAGHQPMCCDEGRFWIIYNGEVYNHLEIREELQALGCRFVSHCDTEVILKAYQNWGIDCLHRFNGMFAFVIYDRFEKRFFVARDRFGVKPLYYWRSPKGFIAFASEIKQFTVLPGWQAKMDHARVHDFLTMGVTDHSIETLFRGVSQVAPGECFEGGLKDLTQFSSLKKRWYTLKPRRVSETFEEASEAFADILRESIRLRLHADVDVGSCLSGGLDSSSIVCLSHALLKEQCAVAAHKTFSACSKVAKYDERKFVEMVVKQTGVDAYYTYPSLDTLFERIAEIVWHQDEPFGSTSIFAQSQVFELAKKNHVKVVLNGQGADEQLGGYLSFFAYRFYDLFKELRWTRLIDDMIATKRIHPQVSPLSLLAGQMLPWPVKKRLKQTLGRHPERPLWINHDRFERHSTFAQERNLAKGMEEQSLLMLMKTSLPMLLRYEDRNSMAHSIESRTPFLDYRLVEYTLGLPSEFKVSKGMTKRVLRKGLEGVLPEGITKRSDKIAFATSEEVWLRKEGPDTFRRAVQEAVSLSQGILNEKVMDELEARISGNKPFCFLPWRLISFGEWIKRFSVEA